MPYTDTELVLLAHMVDDAFETHLGAVSMIGSMYLRQCRESLEHSGLSDQFIQKFGRYALVFSLPLSDLPLLISSPSHVVRTVVAFRLRVGH